MSSTLSRREFVQSAAVASLVVAIPGSRIRMGEAADDAVSFTPTPYLEIDSRGDVSIRGFRMEMGQGIHTGLAILVAEELEADWNRVKVVPAVADPRLDMSTAGSRSIRSQFVPVRTAAAAAKEMLLTAAAQTWNVSPDSLQAQNNAILHPPTRRRAGYGELVAYAATLPVPAAPKLKAASSFRLIGKRIPRVDTPVKVNGRAEFGMDVRVTGMRYAVLVRSPVIAGELDRFEDSGAMAVGGVEQVVKVENAVAVVANSTWAALEGAQRVKAFWKESANAKLSSTSISQGLRERSKGSAVVHRSEGDPFVVLPDARRHSAEYEVPYLAHATMEPQNCTADIRADRAELWIPTQNPQRGIDVTRELTGLPVEKILVHPTYLGGGFGRRGQGDFIREAVLLSKTIGLPVQVVWTREDDMRHDLYRPATYNRFEAALDSEGKPVVWYHIIAGQSLRARVGPLVDGVDPSMVEGAANLPYSIPNIRVEYCRLDVPIPVGAWRSVGSSQNAFVVEGFMDELAILAGADPFEYRRKYLADPRARRVLELAAEKAAWGTPLPKGRYRGIAYAASYGSFAAQVAEVSVDGEQVRVHRVVCALDCGQVVNLDSVEAQIEGAIVYGLTAALYGEITLEGGQVQQGNFDSYPILRMPEMPRVEVYVIPSAEAPGGVGEPGTPPIAPAVVNAIFQATGKRLRRLPIRLGGSGLSRASSGD